MAPFATAIGGAPLIAAAMAQRGVTDQSSPISQVSPSSPSFSPATMVPPPSPMPSPTSGMPQMNQGQPMPPQPMQPPAEKLPMTQENIIVQALIKQLERLDTNKKMPGIQLPPGIGGGGMMNTVPGVGGGAGIGY